MKKLIVTAVCLMSLSACNKPAQATENNDKKGHTTVGSDKDNHGCKGSAGQTWSELKQDCIQIFNVGFRLNPIESKKDEAVISAFVLLNDDQTKAELFMPDNTDHHTIILNQSEKNRYKNDQYTYDSYRSVLYIDGVEKYKGNVE